eukprot:TRINITY_DN6604_c0_g1_i1.p1 TRINITY_DN6604_c0_g1~~TRINITY_DN6604_c0_g1_i1.p1  ORF type:complete len:256 (+),score=28.44 TRINITY_DN6604_c0_g1_i1:118-885(+)
MASLIEELPTEIVITILLHLSPQQIVKFGQTMKYAYEIANSSPLWAEVYKTWFPKFFNLHSAAEVSSNHWRMLFLDVYLGKTGHRVQVINREDRVGYYMSCFTGEAKYMKEQDSFQVTFPTVPPVVEIVKEEKLRPLPLEIRELDPTELYIPRNPTRIKVGESVELQWKRQHDAPFGWWYGVVERIEGDDLWLVFKHFKSTSPWYRIILKQGRVGSQIIQSYTAGGYLGNVRKLNDIETRKWEDIMKSLLLVPLG